MLKFLRKYNTLILVVGGSLLMVVFLVPQAIEQIGQNPSRMPYARVGDRTISQQDFMDVQRSWQYVNQVANPAVVVMQIESADHWMLLVEEAEKYNLIGGPTDGASSIGFFAEYIGQASAAVTMQSNPNRVQTNEQYFQLVDQEAEVARQEILRLIELQTTAGRSEMAYYEALAKLRGIARLLMTYDSLAGLSIPETQLAAADLYDRATADIAVVPASAFRPDPASLDTEEVRAHFEAYRDVMAGAGDFGFGYLLPDAVRYEYLQINSAAIVDSLRASDADLLEYFRRNPDRYFGQGFEDVRSRVRTDYINAMARQRLDAISSDIQRQRTRAAQSLPRDEDSERYRVVPEDWVGPDLTTYAEVARAASGLEGQAAEDLVTINQVTEEFQTLRDLQGPPLGSHHYEFTANERILFGQLLMSAKEFGGDERTDLQRGLLFGPIVLPRGSGVRDLVFVRITDVRQEGPAESLQEVEEQVREDLATLRAYEHLTEQAESFRADFADGGFTWLNDMDFGDAQGTRQYAEAVVGMETVQSASGEVLPDLIRSPLPAEVIRLARTLDPTQPVSNVPADDRTAAVLMPASLSLGLSTIHAYRPTTVNRLREGMVQITDRLTLQARQVSTEAPYSFNSLARRLGFERLDREEEDI